MALSRAEVDEFIEIIRNDADVRERVRAVLLTQDLLELPARVGELRAALEDHIARTDERFDAVDKRFDAVDRRLGKVEGDLGNLIGSDYESRYIQNAPSRLGRHFAKVRTVILGNEEAFHAALADRRISDAEWDEAISLDYVATAKSKRDPLQGDLRLAVELSRVVDASDVERAHRRAEILQKVWPATIAVVDGDQITAGAKARAAELGVVAVVRQEAAEPPAA
ncbi:MAG TPA: hypothetical protein PKD27_03550 [Tepidiformaceae bacterium]|nr:hypothetical protein [Tepidiformaceae bacterium]